jgi:hypothetical protein
MKHVLTVLFLLLAANLYSQVTLRGSMGINFISNPSLKDYLNQNYAFGQVNSFTSAVNFSVEGDYRTAQSFDLGVEAAYQISSFTYSLTAGNYNLSINYFMPSLMAYYVIDGKGYNFKFGGGAGPRFISLDETPTGIRISTTYNSTGFGLLLRFDGNTSLVQI